MKLGELICIGLLLTGVVACASPQVRSPRPFDFDRDIFAYPNQLFWEYDFDEETGTQVGRPRDEPVEFGQRCIVLSRAVRQFHRIAQFDGDAPRVGRDEYQRLIRKVLQSDQRDPYPREYVTIPGYADLRSFSRDYEALLKSETRGAWSSYFQRGNWRMLFPFSPSQQRDTAQDLLDALAAGLLPIVRLVRFPHITINHALLIFAAEESASEVRFEVYDPNDVQAPRTLTFERGSVSFKMPRRKYFAGGAVSVYQAYHGLWF